MPVQDGTTPGKCKSGRIWTYIGDESKPYTVYDYTPDRTRAGPSAWLRDYKGYLQADAYGGYDGIYATGGVTEVACWAHARRKFFDARETDAARAARVAKRHGLDPQAYLRSVLAKIGSTPLSELDQFLPDAWKAEDAAQANHQATPPVGKTANS